MTLEELEKKVQSLPGEDLAKFTEWFESYREAAVLDDVTAAQKEELLRRQAEYLADRSSATDWNDGFFHRLRERLTDARHQKASSR